MDEKKNILFIPYTFSNGGGAEKILQILVNNLPQEKYNITIQEVECFEKKLEINKNIKIHTAFWGQKIIDKFIYPTNYTLLIYFPSLLKKIFFLDNYDAVITYNYQLPSFMLPAFKNEKKVAWFHSDIYDLQSSSLYWEKQRQKKVWNKADKIVTISNMSLQSLYDVFPEFKDKSTIIHNGLDFENVKQLSKEECDFNFSDLPTLICVGRIDQRKNFQFAVRVLRELQNQNVKCKLLIVGDGDLLKEVKDLSESLGVSEKVFFAGFQTNPYKYIAKSKILCVTSLSEGWPTVIMESMSLGIPFITTPVAGASDELVDNERCGLVAGYDEKEYADVVTKLLQDEKLYQQMCNNCKENVKQYSAEKYAEHFMELLTELGVEENQKSKISKISIILSYALYFLLYIISFGDFLFRLQIIYKRIKEKKLFKTIKNIIYLFGLILLWPVIFVGKIFIFPCYVKKIVNHNGGK